jgi:2-polyprenyl-3-methyl-5-hydroxy-6-metoxy-1,4-benzoquinol methylase
MMDTTKVSKAYKVYDADSMDLTPLSPFFCDHVSRYWWASDQASEKTVLDCACGKGYGAYILSKKAIQVMGVDLNPKSLALAQSTFVAPHLSYQQCDVLNLRTLKKRFDLITAFEVIEHLPPKDTDTFLAEIAACLNPGGKLLLSTPNHDVVLKSKTQIPEFHINNFPAPRLKSVLENYFYPVQMLGQYQKKQGISQLIFDIDFLNLRHVIGGPVLKWLRGSTAVNFPVAQNSSPVDLHQTPLLSYFEHPDQKMKDYQFIPRHWRQAGLSVAICSYSPSLKRS